LKNKLTVFSLCALLGLCLVTVRLKTREALLRYDIATYEMYEKMLIERLSYVESDKNSKMGVVALMMRAVELGIDLHLGNATDNETPLLTTLSEMME